MRKITEQAANAFINAKPFKKSNTEVEIDGKNVWLKLHGNIIAWWIPLTGHYEITLAGWPTPTTRERLNGLPNVHVCQVKGTQYLNHQPWDGNWTKIKNN